MSDILTCAKCGTPYPLTRDGTGAPATTCFHCGNDLRTPGIERSRTPVGSPTSNAHDDIHTRLGLRTPLRIQVMQPLATSDPGYRDRAGAAIDGVIIEHSPTSPLWAALLGTTIRFELNARGVRRTRSPHWLPLTQESVSLDLIERFEAYFEDPAWSTTTVLYTHLYDRSVISLFRSNDRVAVEDISKVLNDALQLLPGARARAEARGRTPAG